MKRLTAGIVMLTLLSSLFCADAETAPEAYTEDEFPSWAHDVRRAEIVTLGSLPFTTLAVTMGYQFYRYADSGFSSSLFPNPLAKSSDAADLNTSEQLGILWTAIGISCAIGLTDIVVSMIKRHNRQVKNQQNRLPPEVHISDAPFGMPEIISVENPEFPENRELEPSISNTLEIQK